MTDKPRLIQCTARITPESIEVFGPQGEFIGILEMPKVQAEDNGQAPVEQVAKP